MQESLDVLIHKLRTMRITENHDDYNYLVSCTDKYDDKIKIFDLLRNKNNRTMEIVPLLFTFASKLEPDCNESLFVKIIDFIRGCKEEDSETCEWIVKILFVVLEKIKERRKDSEVRLKLLECIRIYGERTGVVNHLMSLMCMKNTGDIVISILDSIPSISDDFIRNSIHQSNQVFLKNLSVVLPSLSEKQTHLFVNYHHFDEFLDSEHAFMRTCFLEICLNLVEYFKKNEMMDELDDVISVIIERLSDTYFLVRYKSLQVLDILLQRNSIPLVKRVEVIKEVSGRVLDKTMMVRKKAINVCSGLLMNHPFVSEATLEKKKIEENDKKRYYGDLNLFHDLMKDTQDNILILLNEGIGSEINDCIEFIKLSFYYKISESRDAFESLFDLVWTQEMESLLISFKDLFVQIGINGSGLFEFLSGFVKRGGNCSFERILKELSRRRYIDKSFVSDLCSMLIQNPNSFEISYLLSHMDRPLPIDTFRIILHSSAQQLFSSGTKEELCHSLSVYKNIIQIKVREKVTSDDEIIDVLIKSLVKMTFFEHQVVDLTVSAIYSISRSPERDVVILLEKLCSMNKNCLKIISAIGCVGLGYLQYIDEMERLVKSNKADVKVDTSVITPEISERRRSINASRQSISSVVDEDKIIDKSSMLENEKNNRSEEEITDFFFYIKEKEILYGGGGILCVFKRTVEEMCLSSDDDIQVVAHFSLYKLMCISSEFFIEHLDTFIRSMKHQNPRVRANSVIAMRDFLLSYNTMIEGHTHLLFDSLGDSDVDVRKNAILVIHNLLMKNILKVKGHGASLSHLLTDDDVDVRRMVENLLIQISKKESIITTIFYETIIERNVNLVDVIDFLTDLVGEKSKESLFTKALRSKVDSETLRIIHQAFNLGDGFILDVK